MKERLVGWTVCFLVFGVCLYSYLDVQNQLTRLKLKLPAIEKEIHLIAEENRRLEYQMGQFQSPSHLIELARRPEFSHLKHPLLEEVLTVPEPIAMYTSRDSKIGD